MEWSGRASCPASERPNHDQRICSCRRRGRDRFARVKNGLGSVLANEFGLPPIAEVARPIDRFGPIADIERTPAGHRFSARSMN